MPLVWTIIIIIIVAILLCYIGFRLYDYISGLYWKKKSDAAIKQLKLTVDKAISMDPTISTNIDNKIKFKTNTLTKINELIKLISDKYNFKIIPIQVEIDSFSSTSITVYDFDMETIPDTILSDMSFIKKIKSDIISTGVITTKDYLNILNDIYMAHS